MGGAITCLFFLVLSVTSSVLLNLVRLAEDMALPVMLAGVNAVLRVDFLAGVCLTVDILTFLVDLGKSN